MTAKQTLVLQQVQSQDRIRATAALSGSLSGEWIVLTVSLAQRFALCIAAENVNREYRFSEYEFNKSGFVLVVEKVETRKKGRK